MPKVAYYACDVCGEKIPNDTTSAIMMTVSTGKIVQKENPMRELLDSLGVEVGSTSEPELVFVATCSAKCAISYLIVRESTTAEV